MLDEDLVPGGMLRLHFVLSKLDPPDVTVGYEVRLEGGAPPPALRFSSGSYAVTEGGSAARITVQRQGDRSGLSSVRVRSSDGSARAGQDYVAVDRVLDFQAGAAAATFDVEILDDGSIEGSETVRLALSAPQGGTLGGPDRATLTIADDDQGDELRFTQLATLVAEDSGEGTVAVERVGSLRGAVSIDVEATPLSASAGVDYEVSPTQTLRWGDGEGGSRSIPITVFDDLLEEGSELVRLELVRPSAGARAGDVSTAAVVIADDDTPPGCIDTERTLCLVDGRFRIEVDWRNQQGEVGLGGADPDSETTGFFWFFDSANIELIVKALDGRSFNDSYWLFYGALSDVEYWVVAADLLNGVTRVYHNELGSLRGLADIEAFPEDGIASRSPNDRRPIGLDVRAPSVEPDASETAAVPLPRRSPADLDRRIASPGTTGSTCVPGPETLCLLDDRFQVEVDWSLSTTGESGSGTAIPRTDQSGLFWFFDSTNIELVVKVLDARAFDAGFWVFYGALSDVGYTITVTDMQSGVAKQYTNAEGSIEGGADTAAFP